MNRNVLLLPNYKLKVFERDWSYTFWKFIYENSNPNYVRIFFSFLRKIKKRDKIFRK